MNFSPTQPQSIHPKSKNSNTLTRLISRQPSTSSTPLPPSPLRPILKRSAATGRGDMSRSTGRGGNNNSYTQRSQNRVRFAQELEIFEFRSFEVRKREKFTTLGRSLVEKLSFGKREYEDEDEDDKPEP